MPTSDKELYEISITDAQKELIYRNVRLGMSVEDCVVYAGVSRKDWLLAQAMAGLCDYMGEVATDETVGALFESSEPKPEKPCVYSKKAIRLYNESEAFRKRCWQCSAMMAMIEKSRMFLKGKLLQDISAAPESKGMGWTASKWMLEQIDPENYARDGSQQAAQEALPSAIKVEFTNPNSQSAIDRIKAMEDLIEREEGGTGKA